MPDRAENPLRILLGLWFDLKPGILPSTSLVNALPISGLINSHFSVSSKYKEDILRTMHTTLRDS